MCCLYKQCTKNYIWIVLLKEKHAWSWQPVALLCKHIPSITSDLTSLTVPSVVILYVPRYCWSLALWSLYFMFLVIVDLWRCLSGKCCTPSRAWRWSCLWTWRCSRPQRRACPRVCCSRPPSCSSSTRRRICSSKRLPCQRSTARPRPTTAASYVSSTRTACSTNNNRWDTITTQTTTGETL